MEAAPLKIASERAKMKAVGGEVKGFPIRNVRFTRRTPQITQIKNLRLKLGHSINPICVICVICG
jgi:hypothetical protein